jgi:hypothetical protein
VWYNIVTEYTRRDESGPAFYTALLPIKNKNKIPTKRGGGRRRDGKFINTQNVYGNNRHSLS